MSLHDSGEGFEKERYNDTIIAPYIPLYTTREETMKR